MASMNSRVVTIKAEVLSDLASRFLLNLSSEEKKDPIKLCSYIELAHWYYLDLVRPEDRSLPGCTLKEFMATLFKHCPWLLSESATKDLDSLIGEWKTHKFKKPVRGAIILNKNSTKCLLVQGYPSGTSWGFPKGKLEEGEADIDAAVREVYEEIGFDIRQLIVKGQYLEASVKDSHARMYIIPGVSEDTEFQPKTRNEIRNIRWFAIKDLPTYKNDRTATGKSANNFFMIIPFIGQLRRWLASRKRTKISANLKGSKPEQSHSQTRNQTESVQRSHLSPRQEGGAIGMTAGSVAKSSTAPALLPTPPRHPPSGPQSLSPASLLPHHSPSLLPHPHHSPSTTSLLPHPHHSPSTHVHPQSTGPLLPSPFQSPPGPGHTHNITSPLLPHLSPHHPSGHTHQQPYYQQQPLPPSGRTPHTSSLPAALQHLSGHTPSLLPHPPLQQTTSYPHLTAATWGGQSPQSSPALLPTPGSGVTTPNHPQPHPLPPPLDPENPIRQKPKVTLTPCNTWINFKFDREAIVNSIQVK